MYRSDHEAALARIEALESENSKLVEENTRLRSKSPAPKRERVPALVTLVSLTAFGALTFAMAMFVATH